MPIVKTGGAKGAGKTLDYALKKSADKELDAEIKLPETEREGLVEGFAEGARARVLGTNLVGKTAPDFAAQVDRVTNLRKEIKTRLKTLMVSFSPADSKKLTTLKKTEIGIDLIKTMGYADAPFVIVEHRDKPHSHLHIVASRIKFDGQVVNDRFDRLKGREWAARIEKEYQLTPTPARAAEKSLTLPEIKKLEQKIAAAPDQPVSHPLITAQVLLKTALENAKTFGEAIINAEQQGLLVTGRFQNNKLQGFSVRSEGVWLKSSALGKVFTIAGAQQHYGVNYDYKTDDRAFADASARAERIEALEREQLGQSRPQLENHKLSLTHSPTLDAAAGEISTDKRIVGDALVIRNVSQTRTRSRSGNAGRKHPSDGKRFASEKRGERTNQLANFQFNSSQSRIGNFAEGHRGDSASYERIQRENKGTRRTNLESAIRERFAHKRAQFVENNKFRECRQIVRIEEQRVGIESAFERIERCQRKSAGREGSVEQKKPHTGQSYQLASNTELGNSVLGVPNDRPRNLSRDRSDHQFVDTTEKTGLQRGNYQALPTNEKINVNPGVVSEDERKKKARAILIAVYLAYGGLLPSKVYAALQERLESHAQISQIFTQTMINDLSAVGHSSRELVAAAAQAVGADVPRLPQTEAERLEQIHAAGLRCAMSDYQVVSQKQLTADEMQACRHAANQQVKQIDFTAEYEKLGKLLETRENVMVPYLTHSKEVFAVQSMTAVKEENAAQIGEYLRGYERQRAADRQAEISRIAAEQARLDAERAERLQQAEQIRQQNERRELDAVRRTPPREQTYNRER